MSSISSLIKNLSGQNNAANPTSAKSPLVRPSSTTNLTAGMKRKADTALEKTEGKSQKLGHGQASAPRIINALPSRSGLASGTGSAQTPISTTNPTSNTKPRTVMVSGTAPPSRSGISVTKVSAPASKTVTVSNATSRLTCPDNKKGSGGSMPSKPLSFKEKMKLKAQQSQAASKPVGQIVDAKATSLKAMIRGTKGQKVRAGSTTVTLPAKTGANAKGAINREGKDRGNSHPAVGYKGTAVSKKPVALQSTYAGTARPSTKPVSTYRGTARPNDVATKRPSSKPARRPERNEYLGTDEEEEDDEDDYGYDDRYAEASDDYSDMEAGFDDISDEEREATRAAILDDRKEEAELKRLQAEKAARKKIVA